MARSTLINRERATVSPFEGSDRETIALPPGQLLLAHALAAAQTGTPLVCVLVHGGSRIGEGGRGNRDLSLLLSLFGAAPGPYPTVPEPWLLRIRAAEHAPRFVF